MTLANFFPPFCDIFLTQSQRVQRVGLVSWLFEFVRVCSLLHSTSQRFGETWESRHSIPNAEFKPKYPRIQKSSNQIPGNVRCAQKTGELLLCPFSSALDHRSTLMNRKPNGVYYWKYSKIHPSKQRRVLIEINIKSESILGNSHPSENVIGRERELMAISI